MHEGVLVMMQGCIGNNEQGIWIELIDYLDSPMWLINQLGPVLG